MAKNFTRENVRAALVEAIAEKGEGYIYPASQAQEACTYSELADGKIVPSCIVGQVLAKLTPELFEVVSDYEARENFNESATAERLLRGDLSHLSEDAPTLDPVTQDETLIKALRVAQRTQDGGLPWGQALIDFDSTLSTLSNR